MKNGKMDKPHLSKSQIEQYAQCPYKHYWGYKIDGGYRLKDKYKSQALALGSYWDTWMDVVYSGETPEKLKEMELNWEKLDEVTQIRTEVLKEWFIENVDVHPMECQKEVRIPLNDNYDVLGYMDRYTFYEGDPVFIETKMTSRPETYLDINNIEMQMGLYFLSDERLEKAKLEVVYNNTRMKPKKNESIDEFKKRFRREVFSQPEKYFKGWNPRTKKFGIYVYKKELNLDMVVEQVYDVLNAIEKGIIWRNFNNCINQFGKCEFFEVCRNGVDVREDKTLEKKNKEEEK